MTALHVQARLYGYRVTGGAAAHRVELHRDGSWHCDCPSFAYRKGYCKHILAALAFEESREDPLAFPLAEHLAQIEAVLDRMARRWRPAEPVPVSELDASLDWSAEQFPHYAQMCRELGLPLYPEGAPTRTWWRRAARGAAR